MPRITPILLIVPLAVVLAGCGNDSTDSAATTTATSTATTEKAPGTATVKVATTDLGKILVDAEGRTLYAFTPDTATTSACTGGCASAWPPLTATGAPTGDGVSADLTVITRPEGGTQVVAAGHPLYTFAGDAAAGDTTGQGSGGKWSVIAPDGSPVTASAAATTTAPKSRY